MASDSSYGNNGLFIIPSKTLKINICCIASDGEGWEHVSVSVKDLKMRETNKCPTWEQMCLVKDLFWEPDQCAIQFHPPQDKYVNTHNYTLHLWNKIGFEQPVPATILI